MPKPTAALLLRYCALPKLGYLTRTTDPELLLKPAQRFDELALAAQLSILQLDDSSLSVLERKGRSAFRRDKESISGDAPAPW